MINDLKTSQIVPFGFFMGYGGCNPPCRQLPLVLSRINSRALTWRYAVKVVARPADGFGFGLWFTGFSQTGNVARQCGGFVLAAFKLAVLVPLQVIPKTGKIKSNLKTSSTQ